MRTPIVAANWKMNKHVGEAIDVAAEVKRGVTGIEGVEPVICPPFTALKAVGDLLRFSPVKLGAQNVHWESGGAFTGEISPSMLNDLGCDYVLVGHSERRHLFQEPESWMGRKVRAALDCNLLPVLCVGETLEERQAKRTDRVVKRQLESGLTTVKPEELHLLCVAYEPVWAIGTGEVATLEQISQAHGCVRKFLTSKFGQETGDRPRILYGGSVKPDNAGPIMSLEEVDGLLVGGSSLKPESFIPIIEFDR